MALYPNLVQTGAVGGDPVLVDVSAGLGSAVAVSVVIGATPFIATHPPGWPVRSQNTGAAIAEGSIVTFAAGATVLLSQAEAAALVNGGWASYA